MRQAARYLVSLNKKSSPFQGEVARSAGGVFQGEPPLAGVAPLNPRLAKSRHGEKEGRIRKACNPAASSEKSQVKARLILDPPRDGFWNMAADEALFNSTAEDKHAVTLRIYGWSRPTLSLGRRQKFSAIDVEACRIHSVDVVKRIGGGGAVFHGSEISYCFVSCRPPPGMPGMYDMPDVTDPLLWRGIFLFFLESLGITGDGQGSQREAKPREAACFSAANGDEPTINGRKWVGSARRKSRDCFMQHGSILLKPQPDYLSELMPGSGPDISAGLTEFVPLLTEQSATDAFVGAVEKKMRLRFSTGDYTDVEKLSIRNSNLMKLEESQTLTPYFPKTVTT